MNRKLIEVETLPEFSITKPGYSELLAQAIQDVNKVEHHKKELEFRIKQKRTRIEARKSRRQEMEYFIGEWTNREAQSRDVKHLLAKLSDQTLMSVQEKAIERLERYSNKSFIAIVAKELFSGLKLVIRKPWTIFMIITLGIASFLCSAPATFVDLIFSTGEHVVLDLTLGFLIMLSLLTCAEYYHIQQTRKFARVIRRLKNLNRNYLLSSDKLRKAIQERPRGGGGYDY